MERSLTNAIICAGKTYPVSRSIKRQIHHVTYVLLLITYALR